MTNSLVKAGGGILGHGHISPSSLAHVSAHKIWTHHHHQSWEPALTEADLRSNRSGERSR
jgi:hypothetical protein